MYQYSNEVSSDDEVSSDYSAFNNPSIFNFDDEDFREAPPTPYFNEYNYPIQDYGNLTTDNIDSLQYYSNNGYDQINKSLATGKVNEHAKNIDEVFRPIQGRLTVYKGIEDEFDDTHAGAYISTSTDISTAISFSDYIETVEQPPDAPEMHNDYYCCLLRITIPSQTNVIFIEQFSENPEENEVLLDRNGKLTVIDVTYEYIGEKNKLYKIYNCLYVSNETTITIDL